MTQDPLQIQRFLWMGVIPRMPGALPENPIPSAEAPCHLAPSQTTGFYGKQGV